jgi:hypothetical protein
MPAKPNPRDVLAAARASQQRAEESSQTVKQSKTQRVKKSISNDSNTQLINDSISQTLPKYAQLVPFNLRLREDQVAALAELERAVMKRRKQKGGERITKNTLIRVAVDYLIANADKLEGDTEESLIQSFTQ